MIELKTNRKARRSDSMSTDQHVPGSEDAQQHLLGSGSKKSKSFFNKVPAKIYRTAAIVLFVCIIVAVLGDMTGLVPWRPMIFSGDGLENTPDSYPVDGDSTIEAPLVHTINGTYAGVHSKSFKQDYFLGIPFARPPVGELRFRQPQSINQTFSEVRSATGFSPRCVGYGPDPFPMSEDCLYLNVFRPRADDGTVQKDLPVMVWIHAGGFTLGGADSPGWKFFNILEHSRLIHKPFIAVSINYRLSAWGFMAGDDVMKSGDTNVGLRDQRLAMHWVKENIAAFGGDPEKIVLDGQSAGAFSVGHHLTAFGGRDDGLFRGGIMQSGNPGNFGRMPTTSSLDSHYQSLVKAAGCESAADKLECMRILSFDDINNAIKHSDPQWRPTVDGDFVQKQTSLQLEAGEFVHVPIMIGANTDEGTTFLKQKIDSEDALLSLFRSREPSLESYEPLLSAYPDDPCIGIPESMGCTRPSSESAMGTQFRRAAAFVGDFMFIANRRYTCRTWAKAGLQAWCYRFDARRHSTPATKGCGHSEEMPFVFDAVTEPENKLLARLLGNSWASFITDLDPNSFRQSGDYAGTEIAEEGGRIWPSYHEDDPIDFLFKVGELGPEKDTWREEGIEIIIKNNGADGR